MSRGRGRPAAPAAVTTARQSPAERSPQTRREHERWNASTVRQIGDVRGIGLLCGRYETFGNLHPYWVKGAIAERRCRANPSEGDAKAILTTGLRWSAKGHRASLTMSESLPLFLR